MDHYNFDNSGHRGDTLRNRLSSADTLLEGLLPCIVEGGVYELRVLRTRQGVLSGYFTDMAKLAEAASRVRGNEIYVTVNRVKPELLARGQNRLVSSARHTTTDNDVLRRDQILVDFDPRRPAGISSTDREHTQSLARAQVCRSALVAEGFPAGSLILADSGNGAHMLIRIDLPNDKGATTLVEAFLRSVAFRFTDEDVIVDTTTSNAARLRKLYGAPALKGESTPDRPHRLSTLVEVPDHIECAGAEPLEKLLLGLPQEPAFTRRRRVTAPFDIAGWLQEVLPQLAVREGEWKGGRKWVFDTCPFNAHHTNWSAFVLQFPSGAIAAGCHHESCRWTWRDLRTTFGSARSSERPALTVVGSGSIIDGATDEDEDGHPARRQQGRGREPAEAEIQRLIDLATPLSLLRTPEGELYARVPVNSHVETWLLRGTNEQLQRWLSRALHEETDQLPRAASVQSVLTLLEARAQFESPVVPTYTRVGYEDGKIYLDLADDQWRAVEIDEDGWRVITDPPVAFRRARGQKALPEPVHAGELADLRELVHVGSEDDWMLALGWLVMTLHPTGPFPVLLLQGEHGAAKSSATRILRSIVDPRMAPTRDAPRNARDLAVGAHNSWIVALDNLSFLPSWLSDGFCRLATGSGFETRALYSDADQFVSYARRPIVANAIGEIATRGDLIDRAVVLTLPAMERGEVKTERQLEKRFADLHPSILGGLLDVISAALRGLPNVHLANPPRMADFAEWICAASPKLGWEPDDFLEVYISNRLDAEEVVLDSSPLAQAIRGHMSELAEHTPSQQEVKWEGEATELLRILNACGGEAVTRKPGWPADATRLSASLTRLAPALKNKCIIVERHRSSISEGRRRIITLSLITP